MATKAVAALAVAICLAAIISGGSAETVGAHRRSLLAGSKTPAGWWNTLRVKNGNYCALRDFPPIPDGYGSARVYCISSFYDHGLMWRVVKADGAGAIASGDEVLLTIINPMLKYCRLSTRVICGVPFNGTDGATRFVLEKETGTGAINFASDSFYLKAGGKYCGLNGQGHSQELTCSRSSRSGATIFQMPWSSFSSIQLKATIQMPPTNVTPAINNACGGDFYEQYGSPAYVNCGAYFPGMAINLTVALQSPGAPVVTTGTNVTFKTYDDLYTYQYSTWKVDAFKKVYLENNSTGQRQWFQIVNVAAPSSGGSSIANGTTVALLSSRTRQYCGYTSMPDNTFLNCDRDGPVQALPRSYNFIYTLNNNY